MMDWGTGTIMQGWGMNADAGLWGSATGVGEKESERTGGGLAMIRQAWALNRMKMLGAAVMAQIPVDVWLWAGYELEFRPTVARYVAMIALALGGLLTGRKAA